jgi:capsular polysaccharide biosynthesis protein
MCADAQMPELLDSLCRQERETMGMQHDVRSIVIIGEAPGHQLAQAFADRYPEARVDFLATESLAPDHPSTIDQLRVRYTTATSVQQRVDYLKAVPRPQIMVDASASESRQRIGNLQHLYFFVDQRGCYLVADVTEEETAEGEVAQVELSPDREQGRKSPSLISFLTAVAATRSMAREAAALRHPFERELAQSTGRIVFAGTTVLLRKATRHLFKLREWEADDVLTKRYGDSWGQSLVVKPELDFVSRAKILNHGEGPIAGEARTFNIPARHLRRYSEVLCPSFQIAVHQDYALPDTWRHLHQRVLGNRHLIYASAYFARLKPLSASAEPRRLEGSFYLFDTEHPGHYGHITTEVLSRVWGWRHHIASEPTMRPLLSAGGTPAVVPSWQLEIFRALDIPMDDAVVIHPRDVIQVEHLIGATPQFENPFYVDPDIQQVWRDLGAGLPASEQMQRWPRIFVSRKRGTKRFCYQTEQVEEFFAEHGFRVFYPEDLPFQEQAQLFSQADIVAGFGGSGMFTMLLAPTARVILISGDGYNAENEHLIASVNGNELHYFWGRSDVQATAGHTQLEAARSNFTFNLKHHRRALKRLFR